MKFAFNQGRPRPQLYLNGDYPHKDDSYIEGGLISNLFLFKKFQCLLNTVGGQPTKFIKILKFYKNKRAVFLYYSIETIAKY
jgi:hypothetical protein